MISNAARALRALVVGKHDVSKVVFALQKAEVGRYVSIGMRWEQ